MSGVFHWIDSHTHLEHEYPFSVDEYLANARAQGLVGFVTIGTRPESLATLRDFADKYADVFFTVGIHPHEAKDFNAEVAATMNGLRAHPKCVGVGEIGLDYYYDHSPRETQKDAFERQLALALDWEKPIVIHARDAEQDLLDRLAPYAEAKRSRDPKGQGPGIIHCFSGTRFFAEECLKLGFYISFSGIVTFKKADLLRDIARDVPLDRILLETDSPYLAPVPFRGKPNQSAYLVETAKLIAQVKGIDLATLSAATIANSRRVFALPQP
ncbi:MAG: TatD family hydrolase [Deltaproteobacteria bacterium]|nr:TatD family hydrolase [Deltaproteobacteria bacterium]